jgi:hypothetical protein
VRSFFVGAASLLLSVAIHAQGTPVSPQPAATVTGKAAIVGVVFDSLHGRYLADAEVIIEGAAPRARTDSLGRFRVDSLPAGTYQVGVFHPLLDTLSIALATQPFRLSGDSVSIVALSVPPAATIIARSCSARPRTYGNSAVIGQVIDPETLEPISGADISLAWVEFEVSTKGRVRMNRRVVHDTTGSTGRFSVCGLPSSMEASLQATRGNSETAQVTIALGESPTELATRTLLLSSGDPSAKSGSASVSGRVLLEGNLLGEGSRVELSGTDVVTMTNEKGEFAMRNLPSGTHVLVARHLGYAPNAVSVDLSSRERKVVSITLPKTVNVMNPVLVTARRNAALDRVGFTQRKRLGMGHYLGPEQIELRKPNRLTDLFREIHGLRVSSGRMGEIVTTTDGGCVQYYVDNMPWRSLEPGDINFFVNANEVVAVEAYSAVFAPMQFQQLQRVTPFDQPTSSFRIGKIGCGAIVLWTKMRIHD